MMQLYPNSFQLNNTANYQYQEIIVSNIGKSAIFTPKTISVGLHHENPW